MAKRRDNYDGTYYQLPNGRWRAQATIHGKRRGKNFPNRERAKEWLHNIKHRSKMALDHQGVDITFGDFVEITWMPAMKKSKSISYSRDLERRLKRDILPVFQTRKLNEINPTDIQNYINDQNELYRGSRAVQLDHSCLQKIFNDAKKQRLIEYNPAQGVLVPEHETEEFTPLPPDQAQSFIQHLYSTKHPLRFMFTLMIHTGMRIGEVLGLVWSAVDFQNGTISIIRQLQPKSGGGYYLVTPKTKRSRRTIKVSNTVLKILRAQKEIQDSRKQYVLKNPKLTWHQPSIALNGKPDGETPEFIFTSEVGSPLNSCNVIKRFHRTLKECGLPRIRLHDLRHTAATIMLINGIPLFIVSRILGHESVDITGNLYGHLLVEDQIEATEKMEEVLEVIELDLDSISATAPYLHHDK